MKKRITIVAMVLGFGGCFGPDVPVHKCSTTKPGCPDDETCNFNRGHCVPEGSKLDASADALSDNGPETAPDSGGDLRPDKPVADVGVPDMPMDQASPLPDAAQDQAKADLGQDQAAPDQLVSDQTVPDAGSPTCKHPAVVKDCAKDKQGAEWCRIPAGCFVMGSPDGTGAQPKEPCRQPPGSGMETQHEVTLTQSFEIQSTEVTQSQFTSVMGYNPSGTSCGTTCPVVTVDWHEAASYCNALSKKEGLTPCYTNKGSGTKCSKDGDCGKDEVCQNSTACIKYDTAPIYGSGKNSIYHCSGYRLPTEAEWEYAYRAGTTTPYYNGKNDPKLCDSCTTTTLDINANSIAWYCTNTKQTKPQLVGTKKANAWGLHDMAGNVLDWCHDWWLSDLGSSAVTDPVGSVSSERVLRGGSYYTSPSTLRAAYRSKINPTSNFASIGFRCSRTIKPKPATNCTKDKWCRVNPLPDGEDLNDVWGTGPTNIIAVGARGAVSRFDGASWKPMESSTTADLFGVWGTGPSDIFAVGTRTVMHYDGQTWSTQKYDAAWKSLHGVWGATSTDVFAVGSKGLVVHYVGTSWSAGPSVTTEDLNGVWGFGSTNVYAVGNKGIVLRHDGKVWKKVDLKLTPPITFNLMDVWGSGPTNVFVVGETGIVLHYDGSNWSGTTRGKSLYKVWG